ncbi:cytochrome P450 CYP12A2-like isoform X1 [Choristoneura fumiferana]|uniref:cytochrome P450 CYP12A2-like isoform X1 n=1 Tax=Choristoneura fumiferana TaxID=7141 RepID=UPI003D15DDC2
MFKIQTLRLGAGLGLAGMKQKFIRFIVADSSSINNKDEVTQNLKSWREIPGPPSLPIVGPLHNFFPGGALAGYEGFPLTKRIFELYGPIAKIDGIFGKQDMIWLFDADAVGDIYRSENILPNRPGFESLAYYRKKYSKNYDLCQPTGLVTEQGEKWKELRTKVNQIMLQPKIIKLYSEALADVANDMIKRIKSTRDENKKIKHFDVEMNLWALESIGVVALGTRLNCLNPNLCENSEARKLINNIHDFFKTVGKVDFGPSPWRYFSTPNFRRAMKIYENIESLTRSFIYKAMKNMKNSNDGTFTSSSEKPVLEKLLQIDTRTAVIMASDLLLAGVDTVSMTVMATLYLLAKNPEKQMKLRQEVLNKQDQRAYLRACLKESMRMMPVVTGNARVTTKEYNIMGYKIPKDVTIILCNQFMSKIEEEYPNPDEFIPERWLAEKDDPLYHGNAHPFSSVPFGFGTRMCIGRRIAELETETFITKVVENFQINWNGAPPNIAFTTINYITGPFNFVFNDF